MASWPFFVPLLKVTKVGDFQLQTVWVPEWGAAKEWQVVGTVSRVGHSSAVMINGFGLLWVVLTCQSLIKSSPNTLLLWTRIERIGRVSFPSETQAWEWPEQARWTGSPEGSQHLSVLPASSPEISHLPGVISAVHLSKKGPLEGQTTHMRQTNLASRRWSSREQIVEALEVTREIGVYFWDHGSHLVWCVCVCGGGCSHVYMWRSEINTGCLFQSLPKLFYIMYLFFESFIHVKSTAILPLELFPDPHHHISLSPNFMCFHWSHCIQLLL